MLQLGGVFCRLHRILIKSVGFQQFFYIVVHWVFLLLLGMIQTKTMPES